MFLFFKLLDMTSAMNANVNSRMSFFIMSAVTTLIKLNVMIILNQSCLDLSSSFV